MQDAEEANSNNTIIQGLLRRLKPHVVEMGEGHLIADGLFRCITRSAIVKAFEFACHAQTKVKEPFFATATLRGVCEDMITLSFLSSLPNRDEIIGSLIDDNLQEGLECQTSFFKTNRPGQPVVRSRPGQREQAKRNLLNLAKAQRWDRDKLPTVRKMAKASGLVELYDYMYSATSKWVHCSPHVLLRMGWSKEPRAEVCAEKTHWVFSTRQFAAYYRDFNRFYSVYLLDLIVTKFSEEFHDKNDVEEILQRLRSEMKSTLRWPELVTFEELNLDGPTFLQRILFSVANNEEAAQSDSKHKEGGLGSTRH